MQDLKAGSPKEEELREENGIANMKYKPFTSKHCAPSRFTSPLKQAGFTTNSEQAKFATNDAVENAKIVGKFIAQESAGQVLKKLAGNVASKAFGVAGMLLSSQKAYAGGNRTNEEWEKFSNPETVNFTNPNTGEVKSVNAADADAFSKAPEFKDYVRQNGR